MIETVSRFLAGIPDVTSRRHLQQVLNPIADRLSCQTLTSGALRIDGGSASAVVEINAVYMAVVQGKLVTKASGTNMAALVGTVTNATFNVYAFFIDVDGTLTSQMGTAGTTLARVVFPQIPEGKATIGFVVINPTGTGDFVGGTTALDNGTVVPNAVFVNTVGAFDPSVLLQ